MLNLLLYYVHVLVIKFALTWVPRALLNHTVLRRKSLLELGNEIASQLPGVNHNKVIEAKGIKSGDFRWVVEVENRKSEDPVLLYFHGGGYSMPLLPRQASMLAKLHSKLPKHLRFSIAWLDYTLTDKASFPTQVIEAVEAYRVLQKTSSNIVLIGDSAGANLGINLLRHIQQPFEGIDPIENAVKPTGAVLISPWVEIVVDKELAPESSYNKFKWLDTVHLPSLNVQGCSTLSTEKTRAIFDKVNDWNVDWKQILPPAVHTFVSYGECEIMRDSVEEFVRKTGIEVRGGTVYMEPKGIHDSPATFGGGRVVGEMAKFLNRF